MQHLSFGDWRVKVIWANNYQFIIPTQQPSSHIYSFITALFYHIIIGIMASFCWHIYLSQFLLTSLMSFPQHISISRSGNDCFSNPSGTQHGRLSARPDQLPDSPSSPHTPGPWWLLVLSQCLQQHWQPGQHSHGPHVCQPRWFSQAYALGQWVSVLLTPRPPM